VAVRKSSKKTVSRKTQIVVIFWIIFVVVIICVFAANAQTIFKNLAILTNSPESEADLVSEEEIPEVQVANEQPSAPPPPPATPDSSVTQPPAAEKPAEREPVRPQQTQPQTQPPSAPAEMRSRAVYFAQVDRDGQIRQSKVTRRVPASNTPLQDAINAMLIGPNPSELSGNFLSFIPQNTRLLSVTIRGSTAYVNFSEDFLFNKYGVEGYVAQLKQIVWTVTEFDNVKDVQILVDGNPMNYLGEGIFIGAPINRNSF